MVNLVLFEGRLIKDIELKQSGAGKDYAYFTLVADVGYKDNKKPMFVNCTTFGTTASYLASYSSKGDKVLVQGSLNPTEKEGKQASLNIMVQQIQGITKPKNASSDSPSNDDVEPTHSTTSKFNAAKKEVPTDVDIADDDLPF